MAPNVLSSFELGDDEYSLLEIDECVMHTILSATFGNEEDSDSDERLEIETQKNELILKPPLSDISKSFELLNCYNKGLKMPKEESKGDFVPRYKDMRPKLSTHQILRAAGERFIQFTNKAHGISDFNHPYGSSSSSSSLSGLSMDDARDVELVYLLLAAADNMSSRRSDIATQLVSRCFCTSSCSGTPIQRVGHYFAEALREKIDRETGKKQHRQKDEKGLALGTNNSFLATHQELPCVQVMQFAGIQAVIENVRTSQKIHVIDLQIRSGIHWTALMQGLMEHENLHRLKVTAVGTVDQRYMEETGKRLSSFAESLNFSFSFDVVYLNDVSDFKEGLINVDSDETLVVYSFLMLRSMLSRPECLENVMREIVRLNPALMVVVEVEANHNSPLFAGRFVEALFFYAAFFDCLEDCMEREGQWRTVLEADYLCPGIVNTVAAEGRERVTRNVKIEVWRTFLVRFGMTEIELSESSRYQASLVLQKFEKASSWNLEFNGNGLIVGWKGTPLHSLTIWKFT